MKIIGHRGAAGIQLENTIQSIKAALRHGVDAVEFDVHVTSDGVPVVHHDSDLKRLAGDSRRINHMTYNELAQVRLQDGSRIPTLKAVLRLLGDTPAVVEIKQKDTAENILAAIEANACGAITITSFLHKELRQLRALRPTLPLFVAEHHRPFEIVEHARMLRATGITINAWLLNPLTYYRCRRAGLSIIAYTVNHRFIAWWLRTLYPQVMLCTDRPDRVNA